VEGVDTRYSWCDADKPIQVDAHGHEQADDGSVGACYHLSPEVVVQEEEAICEDVKAPLVQLQQMQK